MLSFRRDVWVFAVLLLLVLALGVYQFTRPPQYIGALIEPPKPMPAFTFQSSQGPVSLGDFRGKLVVLYFGYTNCPDICPLTLAQIRQGLDGLGDKAKDVQVIFISVDWKRDTPEKLAGYAAAFRPDFIGLTGTQSEIDAVTRDFGIYYFLNEPDARGYYAVDHSATMLVLDRQGNLVLTWSNGTQADEITADLNVLLKRP